MDSIIWLTIFQAFAACPRSYIELWLNHKCNRYQSIYRYIYIYKTTHCASTEPWVIIKYKNIHIDLRSQKAWRIFGPCGEAIVYPIGFQTTHDKTGFAFSLFGYMSYLILNLSNGMVNYEEAIKISVWAYPWILWKWLDLFTILVKYNYLQ